MGRPSKEKIRIMMKDSEYMEKIKQIVANNMGDKEAIHIKADNLLLEIIEKELGLNETVKEFKKLEKWYA